MDTLIQTKEMEVDNKLEKQNKKNMYKIIKKLVDIAFSVIGIILLIPLTIFVWIGNVITNDKGKVFYKHVRIGKNGEPFEIYKFRTMCNDAEKMVKDEATMRKYFSNEQIKEWNENSKIEHDPRITKVGKILRKTSLDEFPQFINILKGELSLVGPRPIVKEELLKYKENKEKFLSVTPGITGYWAVNGRSATSYDERMKMELYYVDNASLKLDIKIFFKKFIAVIKRRGAI